MVKEIQTLDLRIGEARIIRDITCRLFDLKRLTTEMNPIDWEYQSNGYLPLVKFLENKHNAPIIITNGANQALHACVYALKHKGFNNLGVRTPYWNRIPEIAEHMGMGLSTFTGNMLSDQNLKIDSYLSVMPNNPDGYLPSLDLMRTVAGVLKEQDIPLIHDAVYYNRTCLPIDHPIENVGDVQIFSASKSYGLSSLRLGYMVIYNASFYRLLADFMELSTVGASVPAQKLFLQLLTREEQVPFIKDEFEKSSRDELRKAKLLFKEVNPELIEVPDHLERTCGMFAWVKPKLHNVFEQAKIEVLPGKIFGMPDHVRINLAAGNNYIAEAVKRINSI
jgi:aspartate/methionine/tyrosine aminotransferase